MNPQDLSEFFKNIFRSAPEIVAAFVMGVLLTGVLAFKLRGWLSPIHDHQHELARKNIEISRQDAEIARKEQALSRSETRIATIEALLMARGDSSSKPPQENLIIELSAAKESSLMIEYKAAQARCILLDAENRQHAQARQSLEQLIDHLRAELAQVREELAHMAKWARVYDEENSRLLEIAVITNK